MARDNAQIVGSCRAPGARQIAAQTAELNRELRAAQDRANKILAEKQRTYTSRNSRRSLPR